jgi:hypothetical protein
MKSYDPAPAEVYSQLASVIERWHPDLKVSQARIDLLFVYADEGEVPLKLHGWPCQAVVRIIGDKDRVAGRGDAEIVIDKGNYSGLSDAEKDALLDHELYHLKVKKDRHGIIQVDDHRRPKLKMRPHDVEVGWFDEIAQRHGEASAEIRSARALLHSRGQLYFNFSAPAETPDLHA